MHCFCKKRTQPLYLCSAVHCLFFFFTFSLERGVMPTNHPIRDDDGEYFSEDPTFGIESKSDALANAQWAPIAPMATNSAANAALAQLIRDKLAPKS